MLVLIQIISPIFNYIKKFVNGILIQSTKHQLLNTKDLVVSKEIPSTKCW